MADMYDHYVGQAEANAGDDKRGIVYAILALAEAVRNPRAPERKTGSVKL